LNEFETRVEHDVPLADLTWFGLGGSAAWVVHPRDEGQLAAIVRRAEAGGLPWRVLGGGANVLVSDAGVDGIVIRLTEPAFTSITFDGTSVTAAAGADLMKFANACVARALTGLECLAGIPGTIGGAIRMNAGGRFGEIADAVEHVRVLQTDGSIQTLTRDAVGFGYRHTALGTAIVLSARFALRTGDREEIKARFREYWAIKKASQPMADYSAGCIFKNPPGDSAGRLIDQAGLKGRSRGRARVSDRHANFIVADAGATATDVLALVDEVRETVHRQFGVLLETEIEIWRPSETGCTV
jgi:UDP-N-acetylmuramate dehydrogenase